MTLTVEIDDRAVQLRLRAMPDKARQALKRAVTVSAIGVQAKVQAKLAGPVLKEDTHRLHDSIHYEIEDDAGGVFATVGTNVVYAKVHEFGGAWLIKEHLRKLTMVFGRPVDTPRDILVRAHIANYPERSVLRSTLTEETPAITTRLRDAVELAVRA